MSHIIFKRVKPDEARIFHDGDHVGDLYRHPDILNDGRHYYIVHLSDDPRGPIRVHDRARIPEIAEQRVRTHPLWP